MVRLKKALYILCIMMAICVCFIIYGLYISKYGLEVTHYTIHSDRITEPFRVAHLTDLHDSEFGMDNCKLISKVKEEKPDIILITGDLVNNKSGEDISVATTLISGLADVAPVYFSYGNQEKALENDYSVDIRKLFAEAGAEVLEREYKDIDIKGQKVRIGGIYGYCETERISQEVFLEEESEYLKKFQNTDNYKILLCHMPLCWVSSNSLYDWKVDCVLAGHVHGGQVRIPFVGGLWAPDQGWFPGEMCGLYTTSEEQYNSYKEKVLSWRNDPVYRFDYYEEHWLKQDYQENTLVLSRGLGNTDSIPRFNNIPEVVVVDYFAKN